MTFSRYPNILILSLYIIYSRRHFLTIFRFSQINLLWATINLRKFDLKNIVSLHCGKNKKNWAYCGKLIIFWWKSSNLWQFNTRFTELIWVFNSSLDILRFQLSTYNSSPSAVIFLRIERKILYFQGKKKT